MEEPMRCKKCSKIQQCIDLNFVKDEPYCDDCFSGSADLCIKKMAELFMQQHPCVADGYEFEKATLNLRAIIDELKAQLATLQAAAREVVETLKDYEYRNDIESICRARIYDSIRRLASLLSGEQKTVVVEFEADVDTYTFLWGNECKTVGEITVRDAKLKPHIGQTVHVTVRAKESEDEDAK